jgi:hypothetical protein
MAVFMPFTNHLSYVLGQAFISETPKARSQEIFIKATLQYCSKTSASTGESSEECKSAVDALRGDVEVRPLLVPFTTITASTQAHKMSILTPTIGGLSRRTCPRCIRINLSRRGRTLHDSAKPAIKLAIIGAGPSGFYTASRVLSSLPANSPNGRDIEVHMYERLPTPYGLVRYGVAPDHPEVKVRTKLSMG